MISRKALEKCVDARRMEHLIDLFATIGADERGGVTRLAFSDEDRRARDTFIDILQTDFDLSVRSDTIGNLFARRAGRYPDWPVIMTGSHLDSVRNGGKYDGPAGVFSALEAFRALDLLGIETRHPFELCVFCSEEPNRFGISTFGSRGMTGSLTPKELELLRDDSGNSFRSAMKNIGLDLDRMAEAVCRPGSIKYFLELHIEQMPYLELEKKDIGVVRGVTGIYRERIILTGLAGHSGTTPMAVRADALCTAGEIILETEAAARHENGKAVATVGHMRLLPNSINTVPEEVELDLEVRSFSPERIERIMDRVGKTMAAVQKRRNVDIVRKVSYDSPPVQFSADIRAAITDAAAGLGLESMELVSMAGHDAAHLSRLTSAGMLFIPCRKGISHCPEEYVSRAHLVKGAQCLLKTLLLLDGSSV